MATSRRGFLAGAAAAAAAWQGAPGAACAQAPGAVHPLKTCVFSGMFKAQPLRTAIEAAAAIGYDGIEIMVGFGGTHLDVECPAPRAREIRKMANDHRLAIVLIYTPLGGNVLAGEKARAEGLDSVARLLAIGDQMSCKMLKVTAGRLKQRVYLEDEARTVAAWLAKACDRAEKHGARIVAETHLGQYCETVAMARRMIHMVDRPNFGVIHDAGNLHIAGDSYTDAAVKLLGQRIFHVHIKDMVRLPDDDAAARSHPAGQFKRALLNEGNVDHLGLFRALHSAGYTGYLSCEASGGDDPLAVARHEYAEMLKLFARMRRTS